MKPHIFKSRRFKGMWCCTGEGLRACYGKTPREAYDVLMAWLSCRRPR